MKKTNTNKQKLQKEFNECVKKVRSETEPFLKEAHKQLKLALDVCEKYGVPFCFSINPLYNKYYPESFSEKWSEKFQNLSEEELEDICDDLEMNIDDMSSSGWQHSYIC